MEAKTHRMPVLFVGHGSPMNAVAENDYTRALVRLGKSLPHPRAILAVSAHWLTRGVWLTHMQHPGTIHDFYGFPDLLYQIRYPAPGAPELAGNVHSSLPGSGLDEDEWGLDHGSWAVLRHMYPDAGIPVVQLSIAIEEPPAFHYELGKKLRSLRDEGVLILGSGNLVHNLRQIRWEDDAEPFDWALKFDQWVKQRLENRDIPALLEEATATREGKLSIPTPDHYYPLHYVLGAADERDRLKFQHEGIQNGSVSMRCLTLGEC